MPRQPDDNQSFGAQRDSEIPLPVFSRGQIGRFELIYPIARGGMASVYVGRLSGMAGFEKLFAIKVIHPHLSGEREFVHMFLDEARIAARIQHPNVGEIFEVGEDKGLLFMVMELIDGHSLRAFYTRAAELGVDVSPSMSALVLSKVCLGLQAAHDLLGPDGKPLGIVHRDISPSNVLISYKGYVKLIDFGVAWAENRISHTRSGTIKGKIGFLPPEQIRGLPLDRRAEIFSLGVVLYLMLTGEHPFPGESDPEKLHRVLNGTFKRPRAANPNIDLTLERIVLRAMALRPDDRYPSAKELGRDLEIYLRRHDGPDGPDQLAALMRSLFADDQIKHQERLKQYRERGNESVRINMADRFEDDGNSQTPRSSVSMPGAEAPTERTAPISNVWKKVKSYRLRAIWYRLKARSGLIALGGLVALGLGALLVFVAPSGQGQGDDLLEGTDQARDTLPKSKGVLLTTKSPATGASAAKPKMVNVRLSVTPQTAAVALDGKGYPPATRSFELPADGATHTLEISATGFVPVSLSFKADKDVLISERLDPRPAKTEAGQRGKKHKSGKKAESQGLSIRKSPY